MALFEEQIGNEYIRLLAIMLGTACLILISYIFLKLIAKIVCKGEKTYGRFISNKLLFPVFLLVLLSGLYLSLKTLPELEFHYQLIDALFFTIIVFIIAFLTSRLFTVITTSFFRETGKIEKAPGLINKAISVVIFIIAIAVILAHFKIDITPLIAGVGLGALAIGLALQSTLSNFFAGLHLLSDKPIEIGDYIEIDENTRGFVEDIGWRSTRIRTLTDNLLIIPNGRLAESNIINFSKPKQDLSLWVRCGVAYTSDLKKVEKVTLEVAREIQRTVEGAVKDFEPVFRYREFGDSNINFTVVLRVKDPNSRFYVVSEFIKALKERYDRENIEISWPVRKVYTVKETS